MSSLSPLDTIGEQSLKCIRCGFCLDSCPTFRLTGNETLSPRGRIYLMRSVAEGVVPLNEDLLEPIDTCLGCRACEATCPSGVQYGEMLEAFRSEMERTGLRPMSQRISRQALLETLTRPKVMSLAIRAGKLMNRFGGQNNRLPSFAASWVTGKPNQSVKLPLPRVEDQAPIPQVTRAIGETRFKVALLTGCVMQVMFREVHRATVHALAANGCEVHLTPNDLCCGALHLHTGNREGAIDRANQLMNDFDLSQFDALIVNSAGCGSTLKEYQTLFDNSIGIDRKAEEVAAKTKDICEWLLEIGMRPPSAKLPLKVTYHDACHLAHAQRITSAPRQVLRSIPGVELIEMEDSDLCCGSAGIYNLVQPEMAEKLQTRKLENVLASNTNVVASANPGCTAWIRSGLEERGHVIRVAHPVELLAEAYLLET